MLCTQTIALGAERRVPHRTEAPFGVPLAGNFKKMPFGYTGHRAEAQTGHWSALHRQLDPRAGRWTQADPAGSVDGLNRFAYAANSPVSSVDPEGLWSFAANTRFSDKKTEKAERARRDRVASAMARVSRRIDDLIIRMLSKQLCPLTERSLQWLIKGYKRAEFEGDPFGRHPLGSRNTGAFTVVRGEPRVVIQPLAWDNNEFLEVTLYHELVHVGAGSGEAGGEQSAYSLMYEIYKSESAFTRYAPNKYPAKPRPVDFDFRERP